MTTDNKTLAAVQPGGRVRLGNGLPEAVAQALATVNEAANDARHAGNYKVANALVTARVTLSKQLLALSAQPSPAGQGEALAMIGANLRSLLKMNNEVSHTDPMAWANMRDEIQHGLQLLDSALAARQPVGEPVLYIRAGLLDACRIIDPAVPYHRVTVALTERDGHTVPLYAAPPGGTE